MTRDIRISSPRVGNEMRQTLARIGILLAIFATGLILAALLSSCGGGYGGGGGGKSKTGGTTTGKGY
jgi:hypothetical protein